jgi:broad specificity phosphatase PhoE
VRVFVVRHVKAGSRSDWDGDDDLRPISKSGQRQAASLAARLGDEGVTRLTSSPFLRCRQSLEPLGEAVGLPVLDDERLREGAAPEEVLAAVRESPDGTVLCSHGDVIPELISGLVRRGMELTTAPDWRKATLWILEGSETDHDAADVRLFTSASVEPPPRKHT